MTIDRFSHLLGLIYEAALEPGRWSRCFEEICTVFSANYVSLIVRADRPGADGLIYSGADDRRSVANHNPYQALSPFTGLPLDKVMTIGDLLTETEWRASAYYTDWCAPQKVFHVMAVDFAAADYSVYGFRLTRPEHAPAFSASERQMCERLVSHLKRALNVYQTVHQDRQIGSMYSQAMAQMMVGVVVLDEAGHVLDVNRIARGMLDQADGLNITGTQLTASYANDNHKLQRMVREMLRAPSRLGVVEAMSVARRSGKGSWSLVVRALSPDEWTEAKRRPTVAVFMRDPEEASQPPLRLAQQLFDLTPAETSLVIQLANGYTLDEAGEMLNIRRNTARAHLRSIFSKTGVRRQTELVRMFLNSAVLLGTRRPVE
jgi:DNA-binding CsgD family transcriptional regulator